MFKKVLITGGAGAVGSYLVEALINQGCFVVVVDNLSSGSIENLKHMIINFPGPSREDRSRSGWKQKFLLIAIVLGFLFMFSAVYLPAFQIFLRTVSLKPALLLIIFSFGILNIVLIELTKWLFLRKKRN